LLHVWHVMDQSIIDSAVDEWPLRLRACVQTRVDTTSTCCDIIARLLMIAGIHVYCEVNISTLYAGIGI